MEKKGEKQKAEGAAAVDTTDRFEFDDAHSEFSFRDETYQKTKVFGAENCSPLAVTKTSLPGSCRKLVSLIL